jgi:hypothetical protein
MKKALLLPLICFAGLASFATGQADAQDKDKRHEDKPEYLKLDLQLEPQVEFDWARDVEPNIRLHQARTSGGKQTNPLMVNHGGKIMPTAIIQAIFWGTSWSNAGSTGDKITGMDSWYSGYTASNSSRTVDEYTGTNGQVGATTTYLGHMVDTTSAAGGSRSSAILAEVCKLVRPDPSGNGYYPVYTDVPRGSAGYCAYHSSGTCGTTPVQFAFFWRLDGDSGCDPMDTSNLHSQGLAAISNVSGHELSEARSDPASPGAWYDSAGSENGDKCAWTFGAPLVTFSNNTQWKIQGEWSNAAYTAGTGYPNSSGQNGCIAGK